MTTENTTTITGKKCLVTTNAWFYAPDGRQYRAAWGTVSAAVNAEQALGIKVNRQSADWYLQIGNLTIAGCQIHYVVETPHCVLGPANDWSAGEDAGIKEYRRPSGIYNADGAIEIALTEQANVTLINDSAVDLVAEQANEPKYKKIEGVDHDPYYEPVEPHAELKAMYEQQVKDGTLDNYVWEYKFHLSKEFVPLDGSVVVRRQLLTYADHEYRCTPKPTCQVCNLDTDEFKTMTPEAAKLLQAELGDTVQWWLGFTNMNEWKTLDFNLTGLYSYKLKAKPPRRAPPPLVWPDLECVHDWVQNLQDAHRTCIYCKKSEPIETLA